MTYKFTSFKKKLYLLKILLLLELDNKKELFKCQFYIKLQYTLRPHRLLLSVSNEDHQIKYSISFALRYHLNINFKKKK